MRTKQIAVLNCIDPDSLGYLIAKQDEINDSFEILLNNDSFEILLNQSKEVCRKLWELYDTLSPEEM